MSEPLVQNSDGRTAEDGSLESLVGRVADEFLQRRERGEQPEIEEYVARYPDAAELLRKVLAALQVLELSGTPAPADAPATGTLGDFRLLREVGRGGMGIVYEAEQISLGRRVALKVLPFAATLDPRQLQRFQNEARAAASLEHPHIVPVYAVGSDRGVHYYAMKFVEGQSLDQLIAGLREAGGLTPARAAAPAAETTAGARAPTDPIRADEPAHFRRVAEWGIQAADALEHAHGVGIVHRDIKPANLLIDAQGKLWITDFGLARLGGDGNLTLTGDVVGTLRYMSPEQALAKRGLVDHRSDVYSLGATLYELLTLRPAFDGPDKHAILHRLADDEPAAPRTLSPAVPRDLETVVLKALAKEPADRYASARDLADDLRRFLEHRTIQARPPGLVDRGRKWLRRYQLAAAAFALAGLMALAALAVALVLVVREKEATKQALEEETKQRGLATQNVKVAQQQRQRADSNFRRVIDDLSALLVRRLDPDAEAIPEVIALRKMQRDDVRKAFQSFTANDAKEPGAWLERGLAHVSLSQIYRIEGDHAKGLEALQEGVVQFRGLAGEHPDDVTANAELAGAENLLGEYLLSLGRKAEAIERFEQASHGFERGNRMAFGPRTLNDLAWFLCTCPVDKFRDPRRAIALATEVVTRRPKLGTVWNTLGVAYYRAGEWDKAVDALRRSVDLAGAVGCGDGYFLAMAHWQLGNKEEARRYRDLAAGRMATHEWVNFEIGYFDAEATVLMGPLPAGDRLRAPPPRSATPPEPP